MNKEDFLKSVSSIANHYANESVVNPEKHQDAVNTIYEDFMAGVDIAYDMLPKFKSLTEEQFYKFIRNQQKYNNKIDEVSEALGCAIYDSPICEYGNILFDKLLTVYFDENGVDVINWWLYEKSISPDLTMTDSEDNEIPTETLQDIWNIVKFNLK